jgi:tetratricopeptide (TPR) repeat protein
MTAQEFFNQTMTAFDAGKFDEALKAADSVIAASGEADMRAAAWFMKGVSFESQGNNPEAVNSYTEASKLDPSQAQTWFHLSKLLITSGRFAEALPAIRKAIAADPTLAANADAVFVLSNALNETGDSNGALQAIEEAAKTDPPITRERRRAFPTRGR